MYKDPEPDLMIQADEQPEEIKLEIVDKDPVPPLSERLVSWIESIDR